MPTVAAETIERPFSVTVAPKTDATVYCIPNLMAGFAGPLMGHRMAQWYRSVSWCLERAAHYEHKAERAVDPAARQSFLDAANRWRQSAEIYQSMNWVRADPSKENDNSEPQRAGFAQHVLDKARRLVKMAGIKSRCLGCAALELS